MYPPSTPASASFIPGFLPELTRAVMDLLDGDDMTRLRQVSRLAETHVISTIHIHSRALFAPVVWDYERLVNAFDDNHAVVGGPGAVYILFPNHTLPDYIHIYMPHDQYYDVIRYLERRERFAADPLVAHLRPGETFPKGIANIVRLTKGRLTIDAIQSPNRSPLYPITSALHTGYFNYVSVRSYGSSYPSLTRQHCALLNPIRLDKFLQVPKDQQEDADRWVKLGWTLQVEWEDWSPGGVCDGVDSVGCVLVSLTVFTPAENLSPLPAITMHEHIPPHLQLHVCKFLPLPALLSLRLSSHKYLELVKDALHQKLCEVVAPFIPKAEEFIHMLNVLDAFIGGDGALSFLLRDEPIDVDSLDVYVGNIEWKYLVYHLTFTQGAYEVPCPHPSQNASPSWLPAHGVESVIRMCTTKGDINIYCTSTYQSDPLTPIARSSSTIHFSYVNGRYCGTGYPSLLFQHKGLLSDGDPDDTDYTQLYISRGFDIRLTARAWPEFRHAGEPCAAHKWSCTAQARRFTDRGALFFRFEPFAYPTLHCTVIWRLDRRPCGGQCLMDGLGILREWQIFDSL
ncbi:hypothetical protein C8T65DRAFT_747419 [Cerioporus squamosus]|nr:hypothetical protein C8T65DRAFT_747419 [Cerioporus squamosus]